jgi:valyl-tRNA synthetase
MEITTGIRHLRAEMNVPLGKQAEAVLITQDKSIEETLNSHKDYIKLLSNTSVEIVEEMRGKPEQAAVSAAAGVEIILPLKGLIDIEKERDRILKQLKEVEKDLNRVQSKLKNDSFLAKAPADVVEKERKKHQEFMTKHNALKERMKLLVG